MNCFGVADANSKLASPGAHKALSFTFAVCVRPDTCIYFKCVTCACQCAWMLTGKTMEEIIKMYSTKHDKDKEDPPFAPDAPASSLGFVSCT